MNDFTLEREFAYLIVGLKFLKLGKAEYSLSFLFVLINKDYNKKATNSNSRQTILYTIVKFYLYVKFS